MAKIISPAVLLNEIDSAVLEAVKTTSEILRSDSAKNSEKLSAAKALINYKVTFMSMQRQQVFDKIEQRIKLIKAQMDEIKLSEIQAILNPNATSIDRERVDTVSRVFEPSMRPRFADEPELPITLKKVDGG